MRKQQPHKNVIRKKHRKAAARCRRRSRSRRKLRHYSVPPFAGPPNPALPGSSGRSGIVFEEPIVIPRGDGSFLVAPGKLRAAVLEVGTYRAAEMLGIGYTALRAARESRLGRKLLRWRYTSEKQRVLAGEVPSLMAYKEATRAIGK